MSWFTSIRDSVEKAAVIGTSVATLGHVNLAPVAAKSVFAPPPTPAPSVSPVSSAVVSQPQQPRQITVPTYSGGNSASAGKPPLPQPKQTQQFSQSINPVYLIGGFFLMFLLLIFKRG